MELRGVYTDGATEVLAAAAGARHDLDEQGHVIRVRARAPLLPLWLTARALQTVQSAVDRLELGQPRQ